MTNKINNMLNINKGIMISLLCVSLIFSFFVFNWSRPGVSAELNNAPVANAGPDKETYETESIVLQGSGTGPDSDNVTYSWACAGGALSSSTIAQPLYYAPSVSSATNYICTLTVTDPYGLSHSDSMNVLVRVHESPTLYVSLAANPNSGCAPLTNVDLSASVYGTATGIITYFF